jgi:hypothetical protein
MLQLIYNQTSVFIYKSGIFHYLLIDSIVGGAHAVT